MKLLTREQRYQILVRIIKELNTFYTNGVSYNTIVCKPPYNTNYEMYYKSFLYRDCISFYVEHMKKCFAEPIDGVDVLHEYTNELRRRNQFYMKFSDDEVLIQNIYRFRKTYKTLLTKVLHGLHVLRVQIFGGKYIMCGMIITNQTSNEQKKIKKLSLYWKSIFQN